MEAAHPVFSKEGIESVYGGNFINGNGIELLAKGEETFNRLLDVISTAEKAICLQFYIFRNDQIGTALASVLRKKALSGSVLSAPPCRSGDGLKRPV